MRGVTRSRLAPLFKPDASNSAAEQLSQAGMHHDGMHFFPLPAGQAGSSHGLLAVNHEYTDDGLLHPGGMDAWSADKVKKSQAAHGVSVIEVRLDGDQWSVVRPSRYARRITAATPIGFGGPAAGHAWLQTAADPTGRTALGTINNCAQRVHPVGHVPHVRGELQRLLRQSVGKRCPSSRSATGSTTAASATAGTSSTSASTPRAIRTSRTGSAGWWRSIPSTRPAKPVKRTAMGRFKHEGAALRRRVRPAASSSTWATTSASSTSTSS